MEAAGPSGTTGSRTSSGAPESSRTQSSPTQTGGSTEARTSQESSGTGREQEPREAGRIARREAWDDQLSSFFGGSPFALFRRLSDDMDRLFFGGSQGVSNFGPFGGRFMPHIDVEERDDRVLVRADLPGCRPEDFHVDIEDDALVIQGERRAQQDETRGGIRRSERSYGSFRRVIALPPGANPEAADARFENGVLEISVPVQQQSRSRRLDVRSGGSSGPIPDGGSGTSGSDSTRH
jgi:HSP20 family protein